MGWILLTLHVLFCLFFKEFTHKQTILLCFISFYTKDIAFFTNWQAVATLCWEKNAFFQQHFLTSCHCVTFWKFSQHFTTFRYYYIPVMINDLWCNYCGKIKTPCRFRWWLALLGTVYYLIQVCTLLLRCNAVAHIIACSIVWTYLW